MDLLVLGQRPLVVPGASVAGGNDEVPLDLGRLDQRGPLEVQDGLLRDLVLDEVGAQPVDHLKIGWVEPGRLGGGGGVVLIKEQLNNVADEQSVMFTNMVRMFVTNTNMRTMRDTKIRGHTAPRIQKSNSRIRKMS